MAFKQEEKQAVIICKTVKYPEIPQRNCRWLCVTVRQVRVVSSKRTQENLHVFVCAHILIKDTARWWRGGVYENRARLELSPSSISDPNAVNQIKTK